MKEAEEPTPGPSPGREWSGGGERGVVSAGDLAVAAYSLEISGTEPLQAQYEIGRLSETRY